MVYAASPTTRAMLKRKLGFSSVKFQSNSLKLMEGDYDGQAILSFRFSMGSVSHATGMEQGEIT